MGLQIFWLKMAARGSIINMTQTKIILAQLNDYWAEESNLPGCFLKAMAYKKGLLKKNIEIEVLENSIANKSRAEAIN